jgi:hypothetical protein
MMPLTEAGRDEATRIAWNMLGMWNVKNELIVEYAFS